MFVPKHWASVTLSLWNEATRKEANVHGEKKSSSSLQNGGVWFSSRRDEVHTGRWIKSSAAIWGWIHSAGCNNGKSFSPRLSLEMCRDPPTQSERDDISRSAAVENVTPAGVGRCWLRQYNIDGLDIVLNVRHHQAWKDTPVRLYFQFWQTSVVFQRVPHSKNPCWLTPIPIAKLAVRKICFQQSGVFFSPTFQTFDMKPKWEELFLLAWRVN